MLAALDIPIIRRQAVPISVSTYHGMIKHGLVAENVELIRGVIVEKMPKSSPHSIITSELYKRLEGFLPDFWVRKEDPLTMRDSEPEPDISIVPGKPSDYWGGHPTSAALVVEVAVTSAEIDRQKGEVYAEAGVPEYWIVLAEERAVEVYTAPESTGYKSVVRFEATEDIRCSVFPGVIIPHAPLLLPPSA